MKKQNKPAENVIYTQNSSESYIFPIFISLLLILPLIPFAIFHRSPTVTETLLSIIIPFSVLMIWKIFFCKKRPIDANIDFCLKNVNNQKEFYFPRIGAYTIFLVTSLLFIAVEIEFIQDYFRDSDIQSLLVGTFILMFFLCIFNYVTLFVSEKDVKINKKQIEIRPFAQVFFPFIKVKIVPIKSIEFIRNVNTYRFGRYVYIYSTQHGMESFHAICYSSYDSDSFLKSLIAVLKPSCVLLEFEGERYADLRDMHAKK